MTIDQILDSMDRDRIYYNYKKATENALKLLTYYHKWDDRLFRATTNAINDSPSWKPAYHLLRSILQFGGLEKNNTKFVDE